MSERQKTSRLAQNLVGALALCAGLGMGAAYLKFSDEDLSSRVVSRQSREIPEIPASQLQETVQYNLRKLKMVEEELDEEYRDDSLLEETSTQESTTDTTTESTTSATTTEKLSERLSCVSPASQDWNNQVEPLYKTNPSRFILPALIWGPMNQVEGFRETIALAIALNRTFVIPPMFRHFTDDNDPNGVVDAAVRIDIGKVRQLVSTVDFHNLPKHEVDDVLVARGLGGEGGKSAAPSASRLGRVKKFESATGLEMVDWRAAKSSRGEAMQEYFVEGTKILPEDATLETDLRNEYAATKWNELYPSEAELAVLLFPYLTAHSKNDKNDIIGRNIIHYTPRPEFVRNMAVDFLGESSVSGEYVALHYRFDKEDWERSCSKESKNANRNANRSKICSIVMNMTADKFALSLASFLESRIPKSTDDVVFYVATPTQQQQFIAEVVGLTQTILRSKYPGRKINGKSTADSLKYVESSYANCAFLEKNMHEVFSLFEQEICFKSGHFIYADSSSWSGSIRRERRVIPTSSSDLGILDLLEHYPATLVSDKQKL